MTAVRRSRLIVALVVAVLALAGSVATVAAGVGRNPIVDRPPAGAVGAHRPGMMGGAARGMMGADPWRAGCRYGLRGMMPAAASGAAWYDTFAPMAGE